MRTNRRKFLAAALSCPGLIGVALAARGANPPEEYPANGIYPRGRKLAFMGYSGDPARDLANGFTVAGPVYGDQKPYLDRCFAHGWPVVAHVGLQITFADKSPAKYKLNAASLRQEIDKQVRELAAHKEIVCWAIRPEELRPWRGDEMQYLNIVCDTIRKTDPLARPIYLYNPNNRDAKSLSLIAKQVDIIAKGCYVNLAGHKLDRAWVRWSIEQEIEALRIAGRPRAIPLLMPELCKDPEPEEDKEIRAWARHDVYLGMASGAKGVLIWSLFKRREVKRTWQLWYDAYSECARELNGRLGLAQVFLFGERRSTLKVQQVHGAAGASVKLGGYVEPATTSNQERAQREIKLPSWTSAEFACGKSHWLFLVNSANAPASFAISGWPKGARVENVFQSVAIETEEGSPRRLDLPAYGVIGVRFSLVSPSKQNK
jgi:hypothetical protein